MQSSKQALVTSEIVGLIFFLYQLTGFADSFKLVFRCAKVVLVLVLDLYLCLTKFKCKLCSSFLELMNTLIRHQN